MKLITPITLFVASLMYIVVLPDTLYYALGIYLDIWIPTLTTFWGYFIALGLLLFPIVNIGLVILLLIQSFHVSYKFLTGNYDPSSLLGYITIIPALYSCIMLIIYCNKTPNDNAVSKLIRFSSFAFSLELKNITARSVTTSIQSRVRDVKNSNVGRIDATLNFFPYLLLMPFCIVLVIVISFYDASLIDNFPGVVNVPIYVSVFSFLHITLIASVVVKAVNLFIHSERTKLSSLRLSGKVMIYLVCIILTFWLYYSLGFPSSWKLWFGTDGLGL